MISIIASCISEFRISFSELSYDFQPTSEFQLSGGVAECCAIVWVVEPLLALGFASRVLILVGREAM